MKDFLTISELIGMVQDELIKSQKKREVAGREPLFQTDELELEMNTELTTVVGGKLVLSIPVFKVGTSGNDKEKNTQRIKLKFKVIEKDGEIDFKPGRTTSRMDGRLPKLEEQED